MKEIESGKSLCLERQPAPVIGSRMSNIMQDIYIDKIVKSSYFEASVQGNSTITGSLAIKDDNNSLPLRSVCPSKSRKPSTIQLDDCGNCLN